MSVYLIQPKLLVGTRRYKIGLNVMVEDVL